MKAFELLLHKVYLMNGVFLYADKKGVRLLVPQWHTMPFDFSRNINQYISLKVNRSHTTHFLPFSPLPGHIMPRQLLHSETLNFVKSNEGQSWVNREAIV